MLNQIYDIFGDEGGIVPVLKKNGNVRICGDYKLTANISASVDTYPLPKIEDLFTDLSGGKTFTKLDLAQAYLQLPLSEDSKPLTTINTHHGLYQYNECLSEFPVPQPSSLCV